MAQRRFHYDLAFEHYLRSNAIPYVAVDEAKRALAPTAATPKTGAVAGTAAKLKSFDFVVYSERGPNLLVDVKGRKHSGRSSKALDNWVTQYDVDSLRRWEGIFGSGFQAAFAFLYWCDVQPPDALFLELFEFNEKWYAVLAIRLADYERHLKRRSVKWDTVNMPAAEFTKLAVPLKQML